MTGPDIGSLLGLSSSSGCKVTEPAVLGLRACSTAANDGTQVAVLSLTLMRKFTVCRILTVLVRFPIQPFAMGIYPYLCKSHLIRMFLVCNCINQHSMVHDCNWGQRPRYKVPKVKHGCLFL